MKVTWDKIYPGDFFFLEMEEFGQLLYQRINDKNGYNVVLLNSGELCQIHPTTGKLYHKTTVTFNIHGD
jgi:hypothetical protein